MNTRNTSSLIRRISLVAIICALSGVVWFVSSAESVVTTTADSQMDPFWIEATLNGEPNMAPGSMEYAIEKEFYLPHVVDLAAGSKFDAMASASQPEAGGELANALSGQTRQCNMRAHGALAMNDQGCY